MHVAVNGTRLWVERAGDGPPVLLLHGFPETHRSWDLQVPFLLEHGYSIVRPDLRGYGRSDRPDDGYEIENLARDIAALIRELGLAPVRLVGHDWGGGVAWETATRFPELCRSVCVIACPHPVIFGKALRTNRRQMQRSWYIAFFQLPALPERWLTKHDGANIARMFRAGSPGESRTPPEIVEAARSSLSRPGALRGPLAYYRTAFRSAARRPPTPDDYPAIPRPVTLIWGEADSCLGTELMRGSERYAPELTTHVVANAGHFVHQESPDVVNRMLLEALA
jgi:pimeloyl-ACP methyl ester carboxylesterase